MTGRCTLSTVRGRPIDSPDETSAVGRRVVPRRKRLSETWIARPLDTGGNLSNGHYATCDVGNNIARRARARQQIFMIENIVLQLTFSGVPARSSDLAKRARTVNEHVLVLVLLSRREQLRALATIQTVI